MSDERNWDDPQYRAWRLAVFKRDRFRCKMPNCRSRKRLNAHHIKRWADFPTLRFVLANGITLCRVCHQKIYGVEQEHEVLFTRIVTGGDVITTILLRLWMQRPNGEG